MLGNRIGGRYELMSVIGGGGMAVVYKARDVILDRIVAVKVLRSEFSHDDEFIRRFRREAQSVTSLSNPNIVNIYDVGDNEDEKNPGEKADLYYIVMEYVEGETLKDLIRREAPLSLGQALHIMDQISSALEHAHENSIVHRDVKPQNILIDYNGRVKVTDFGIAVAMSSATITHTNSVIGSAHYFSPEQARGGYADTKSDIYSLGIVLFEMLTGELPFSGTSPISVALKHLQEEIPEPRELNPGIPQSVENIILRAMTKDPLHRYHSVEVMRDDLKTALDPDRLNEPKFVVPDEDGQMTKVLSPIASGGNIAGGGNGSLPTNSPGNDNDKKKSRWPKFLLLLFILFFLLAGAGYAAFSLLPDLLTVKTVNIPKVVGMNQNKAKSVLKQKGLTVDTEKVSSKKYAAGKVTREDPSAGTPVKVKSHVHLLVSKGPEKVTVDNYMGKDKSSVSLMLNGSGYQKISYKGVYNDTYSSGKIIDQNPQPGSEVLPSKTHLVLTYSKGPAQVEVPDLSGSTKEEAQNLLEDRGITPDFKSEEYSDSVNKGEVTRQSPQPGVNIDRGGAVQFWISKGKEQKPITFSQPITVQFPDQQSNGPGNGKDKGNGKNKGKPVHVKLVYSDANHDQKVYKEEDIHDTKTYQISMTVNPGGQIEYWVYVDGQVESDKTKTYDQIQTETGGGN